MPNSKKPGINEDIVLEGISEFSSKHNYKPNYFDCADIVRLYTNGYVAENDDGYDVGKILEDKFGWGMYTERVNELEEVHYNIKQAYYRAVGRWMKEYNIKPKFKYGDTILFNHLWWYVLGQDVIIPYSYKLHLMDGPKSKIDESVYITMWCDDIDREATLVE